jgi:TRAP-type C4-dicarboxylate transport system permease small subunit
MLRKAEDLLLVANRAVVGTLLAAMATLVFLNVVMRYVFNNSIAWTEEISRYIMIWTTYLGAGLALREGRHVAIEFVQDRLPSPLRRAMRVFVATLMLTFMALLVYWGFVYAQEAWSQYTAVTNLPQGAFYLAVPIGAIIFSLHLVATLREYVMRAPHSDLIAVDAPVIEAPAAAGKGLAS